MTKQEEKLSVEAIAKMADLEPQEVMSAVMRELAIRGKRKQTPEERSEIARNAVNARWKK